MTLLPIAVWEQTPYWVPELQRELESLGGRVVGCRTEADVARRLAEGARQLVIALPDGEHLPLRMLTHWVASGLRVHVVLNETGESLRWFLAELSVSSVFDFDGARQSLVRACVG